MVATFLMLNVISHLQFSFLLLTILFFIYSFNNSDVEIYIASHLTNSIQSYDYYIDLSSNNKCLSYVITYLQE